MTDALVAAGLASSKSDARRLAQGGGLKVNDVAVASPDAPLSSFERSADGVIKLAAGKKKLVLVRPV